MLLLLQLGHSHFEPHCVLSERQWLCSHTQHTPAFSCFLLPSLGSSHCPVASTLSHGFQPVPWLPACPFYILAGQFLEFGLQNNLSSIKNFWISRLTFSFCWISLYFIHFLFYSLSKILTTNFCFFKKESYKQSVLENCRE